MKVSELIRILDTLKPDDHISLNAGSFQITPDDAEARERDAWARQRIKASEAANKKRPSADALDGLAEVNEEDLARVFFPGESMWIIPVRTGRYDGTGVLSSVPANTHGWRASKDNFHPGHGARCGDHVQWVWSLCEGEKLREFSDVIPHTAKSTKVAEDMFAEMEKADRKAAKAR